MRFPVPPPLNPLLSLPREAVRVVSWTASRLGDAGGRSHRRHWTGDGRSHIEVRGIGADEGGVEGSEPGASELVIGSLRSVPGVHWAELNGPTGRVVVSHDADIAGVEDLLAVVEKAEDSAGVGGHRFHAGDHPADADPLRRDALALVADLAGLATGVFGRVLAASPLPVELTAVTSFFDTQPGLRRLVENRLGPATTDTVLALANATASALAQGPVGLVLDAGLRALKASESASRMSSWAEREPDLAGSAEVAACPVLDERRPVPLPPDPAERYARTVAAASAGAAAVALVAAGGGRRAASVLVAGLPKAVRCGPSAFAAALGSTLASRRTVVLDPAALRRLHQVDAVVIDPEAFRTGRDGVVGVRTVEGAPDEAVTRFIDMVASGTRRTADDWRIAPLEHLDAEPALRRRLAASLRARGRPWGATHNGVLVAVGAVVPEEVPGLDSVVAACRRAELHVVAPRGCGGRLGAVADEIAGGRLADVVRRLQRQGRVVAVVGWDRAALAVADVGVGVPGGPTPWGADMLTDHLREAVLVLDAVSMARTIAQRSLSLAMGGSAVAAVVAIIGRPARAGNRALLAVNAAAGVALAYGWWSAAELGRRQPDPPVDRTPWHALTAHLVMDRLGAGPKGLSETDAARRRPRSLRPPSAGVVLLRSAVEELSNPLTPVLAAGAALSAAVGSVTDAAIVGGVTMLSALIGSVQRVATDRAVAELFHRSAVNATVMRGEADEILPAHLLVPGDVIRLKGGDLVPADCRILSAVSVEVDESSLTGEPFTVAKTAEPVASEAVAERSSMLYEGTTLATGRATAVVVATGHATEAGRGLATSRPGTASESRVERRLAELTRVTVPIALGSGLLVTASGLLRGRGLNRAVSGGVSLAVAAVPEGLPFLVTAAQLASARRLSRRHALVKNPPTVEALGRVDVLCFDKTGTLTEGRIQVAGVSDGRSFTSLNDLDERGRRLLADAVRASPWGPGEEIEHATDRSVLRAAALVGVDPHSYLPGSWRLSSAIPFEPARGFHASLGSATDDDGMLLVVKGAPEIVLPRCTRWDTPDGRTPLGRSGRAGLEAELERLAGRGQRVLAVARRVCPVGASMSDEDVTDLEFAGYLVLSDPVRETAKEACHQLQRAGIHLTMITGDHPSTARAVAGELGLLGAGRVLTGADVDTMDSDELDRAVGETAVFARVTPAHKVAIVSAYQRTGRTVAMTGDGANDAPAIRLADVGIALGRRGAPAARTAADLIVSDDHIETVVDALAEGRAMWGSVRDALSILLGGNLGEIGFTVTSALATGTSALSTRQFLLVNLLTDLAPAMALAVRAPSATHRDELLGEGPERSLGAALNRQIVTRAVTTAAGTTGAWAVASVTGRPARARTVALTALVGTQLAQTLVAGRSSPAVVATSLVSVAVLVAVVQTPGLSQAFGCTPLGPVAWSTAIGSATVATAASALLAGAR